MDTKKLMAEAEKIITPKLLKQLKKEIEQLGHNSNPEHDWQKLTKHVKGCPLGDLDDHRVFAVDADKVMLFHDMGFVVAGNPEIYDYVPKGQFWVDHCFVDKTTGDFRHDLLHEAVEARMLKAWGKDSYDERAHPAANEFERQYMLELGLDKDHAEHKAESLATAIKPKSGITTIKLPWQSGIPQPAKKKG